MSEDEWTSVTCPQATSEFSCEFTQDSDEDYDLSNQILDYNESEDNE